MIINSTNYDIGNKAMASVLLLYYHLLNEGGITHAQTVYIDPSFFNGFDFIETEVAETDNLEINETLIKEGAIIYLLCDLNDVIGEYDEDFRLQPHFNKIIGAFKTQKHLQIPEVKKLLKELLAPEIEFNYVEYNNVLQGIYKKYVYGFFSKKLA